MREASTYRVDTEHLGVEDCVPELGIVGGGSTNGSFTELLLGDLKGNVGTAKSRAGDCKLSLDNVRVTGGHSELADDTCVSDGELTA